MNIWEVVGQPVIIAAIVTGAIAFVAARVGKRYDARIAAEAALINLGPQIIESQSARIKACEENNTRLEENNNNLWKALSEERRIHGECLNRLAKIERTLGLG